MLANGNASIDHEVTELLMQTAQEHIDVADIARTEDMQRAIKEYQNAIDSFRQLLVLFVDDEELNGSQIELVKELLSKAYIAKASIHEQQHDLLMENFCRRQAVAVLEQDLNEYLSIANKDELIEESLLSDDILGIKANQVEQLTDSMSYLSVIDTDEQQEIYNTRANNGGLLISEQARQLSSSELKFSENVQEIIEIEELLTQWKEHTKKLIDNFLKKIVEMVILSNKHSIIISYVKQDKRIEEVISQLKAIFELLKISIVEKEYQNIITLEKELALYSHAIVLVTGKYKELAAPDEEASKKIKKALDEFGSKKDYVAKLHVLLCDGSFGDDALKVVDGKYLIRDYKKLFDNKCKQTIDFQEQETLLSFIEHLFNPSSYAYGIGMLPSILDLSDKQNDALYKMYKELFSYFYKKQQQLNLEYRFKKVLLNSYQNNLSVLRYLSRREAIKSVEVKIKSIVDYLLLQNDQLKTNLILHQSILDGTLINWLVQKRLMLYEDVYVIIIDCGRKYRIEDKEQSGSRVLDFLKEKLCLKQHEIEDFIKQTKEQVIILFKNYDRLGVYENLYVKNKLSNWPNLKILVTCNSMFFQHRSHESCFLPDPGVIELSTIKADSIEGIFNEQYNRMFISEEARKDSEDFLLYEERQVLRKSSIVELKDITDEKSINKIKLLALHTELNSFLKNINNAFKANGTLAERTELNPQIYISYAWEREGKSRTRQQNHIKQIAKDLYVLGFFSFLDIDHIAGNVDQQIEGNIENSSYVLLIGTPLYNQRSQITTNVQKEFLALMNKKYKEPEFTVFPIKFLPEGIIKNGPEGEYESFPADLQNQPWYEQNVLDFCGIDDGEEYIKQLTSLSNPTGLIPRLLKLNEPGNETKLAEYTKYYQSLQKQLQLLPANHLLVDKGQEDVQAYDMDGKLEVYIEPSGVEKNPANTLDIQAQFDLKTSLSKFLKNPELKTYVILGEAGSGKGLFTFWVFKRYGLQPWHNYRNKNLNIYLCSTQPDKTNIEKNAIYLYLKEDQIQYISLVKNYKHESDKKEQVIQIITVDATNSALYQQIKQQLTAITNLEPPKYQFASNYEKEEFFNLLKPKWLPIYIPLKNYAYPGKNKEGQERKKDDKQTPLSYIEDALLADYNITAQDLLMLKKGLNYEQNILFILDGYDELGKGNNPNFSQALLAGVEDVILCLQKPQQIEEGLIYIYLNDQKVCLLFKKSDNPDKLIDQAINNQELSKKLKNEISSLQSSNYTSLLDTNLLEKLFRYTYKNHQYDLTSHTINWKHAKIFITGRPEHFDNELQHQTAFSLYNSNPQYTLNYMARFTSEEIQYYIEKYKQVDPKCAEELAKLETNKGATTLDILNSFGNLTELLQNPFLLNVTLQALPILLKKYKNSISRATVYEGFIEYWYTKEIERKNQALQRSNASLEVTETSKELCYRFAQELVIQMFIHKTISISEKTPQLWEFFNKLENTFARETCPLRRSGNEYSFIHKSIYEYLVARHLMTTNWLEIQNLTSTEQLAINGDEQNHNNSIARLLKNEPSVFNFIQDFAKPYLMPDQHAAIAISSEDTQIQNLYNIFLELLRWNKHKLSLALTDNSEASEYQDDKGLEELTEMFKRLLIEKSSEATAMCGTIIDPLQEISRLIQSAQNDMSIANSLHAEAPLEAITRCEAAIDSFKQIVRLFVEESKDSNTQLKSIKDLLIENYQLQAYIYEQNEMSKALYCYTQVEKLQEQDLEQYFFGELEDDDYLEEQLKLSDVSMAAPGNRGVLKDFWDANDKKSIEGLHLDQITRSMRSYKLNDTDSDNDTDSNSAIDVDEPESSYTDYTKLGELLNISNDGTILGDWQHKLIQAIGAFLNNIKFKVVEGEELRVRSALISYCISDNDELGIKNMAELLGHLLQSINMPFSIKSLADNYNNLEQDICQTHELLIVLCDHVYAKQVEHFPKIRQILDNFGKSKKDCLHTLLCDGDFADTALKVVDKYYLIRDYKLAFKREEIKDPLTRLLFLIESLFNTSGRDGLGLLPDLLDLKNNQHNIAKNLYKKCFKKLEDFTQQATIEYRLRDNLEKCYKLNPAIEYLKSPIIPYDSGGTAITELLSTFQHYSPQAKIMLLICPKETDVALVNVTLEQFLLMKKQLTLIINCGDYPGKIAHQCVNLTLRQLNFKNADIEQLQQQDIIIILKNYERIGVYDNLYVKNKLSQWPKLKVIVTCRADFLERRDYKSYFLSDPADPKIETLNIYKIRNIEVPLELDKLLLSKREQQSLNAHTKYLQHGFTLNTKQQAQHDEFTYFLRKVNKLLVTNNLLQKKISKNPQLFVSYAWETGQTLVRQQGHLRAIVKHLTTLGISAWLDVERMTGNIDQQMDSNIKESAFVIIIGTPRYAQRAAMETNVKKEYDAILKRTKKNKLKIISALFFDGYDVCLIPEEYHVYLIPKEPSTEKLTLCATPAIVYNPDNTIKCLVLEINNNIQKIEITVEEQTQFKDFIQRNTVNKSISEQGLKVSLINQKQLLFWLIKKHNYSVPTLAYKAGKITYLILKEQEQTLTLQADDQIIFADFMTAVNKRTTVLEKGLSVSLKVYDVALMTEEIKKLKQKTIYLKKTSNGDLEYTVSLNKDEKISNIICIKELPILSRFKEDFNLKTLQPLLTSILNIIFDKENIILNASQIKNKKILTWLHIKGYKPFTDGNGDPAIIIYPDSNKITVLQEYQEPKIIEISDVEQDSGITQFIVENTKSQPTEQTLLKISLNIDNQLIPWLVAKGCRPSQFKDMFEYTKSISHCYIDLRNIENSKDYIEQLTKVLIPKLLDLQTPANATLYQQYEQKLAQLHERLAFLPAEHLIVDIGQDLVQAYDIDNRLKVYIKPQIWRYVPVIISINQTLDKADQNKIYLEKNYDGSIKYTIINNAQVSATITKEQLLSLKPSPSKNLLTQLGQNFNLDNIKSLLPYILKIAATNQHIIAEEVVSEKKLDLQKSFEAFLAKKITESKNYVVLGEAGSGKTLFTLRVFKELLLKWHGYKKKKARLGVCKIPKWLPVYIPLKNYSNEHAEDCINKALGVYELDQEDIESLKQGLGIEQGVVFILDGYDELSEDSRKDYTPILASWTHSKVLLTSRPEHFNRQSNSEEHYIAPLSDDDKQEFIKQYKEAKPDAKLDDVTKVFKTLQKMPSLMSLLDNPFLLNLVLQVLPELLKSKTQNQDITRADIYQAFTNLWFTKESIRHTDDPATIEECQRFAELLSFKMCQAKTISVTSGANNDLAKFFDTAKKGARLSCPLQSTGQEYGYIHKSLYEFFLSNAIYSEENHQELVKPIFYAKTLIDEPSVLRFSMEIRTPRNVNPKRYHNHRTQLFLNLVGWGEQEAAERMLQENPQFAVCHSDLTDCSGRTWSNITALQYTLLALDYHMWTMLLKYMNKEEVRAQIEAFTRIAELNQEGWTIIAQNTNWQSLVWHPLIKALDEYVQNYEVWDSLECTKHWCQKVGGAQSELPAHVINEYNHPERINGFINCKWDGSDMDTSLPRTGLADWLNNSGYKLGSQFAWVRADLSSVRIAQKSKNIAQFYVKIDLDAMTKLLQSRKEQARILLHRILPRKLHDFKFCS